MKWHPACFFPQMRSVLDDVNVRAIKTGMLFDTENTKAVAQMLKGYFDTKGRIPLVCDPVCVSTSGHVLLQPEAVDTVIDELFPLSDLITPNRAEAELLLRQRKLPFQITSLEDSINAARRLRTLGPEAVLLKGGHFPVSPTDIANLSSEDTHVIQDNLPDENSHILRIHGRNEQENVDSIVVDVLCASDGRVTLFTRTRLESTSTHGTGCTLSAALACQLARGIPRSPPYFNSFVIR
jgi:hydroxymethylpyrimidine/phosphomethylpyrimidine kinase / thiaminase